MLLISCDCIVSLKFVQSNDLFTKRANCGIFFCIKETSSSIIEERPSPATEIFFRKMRFHIKKKDYISVKAFADKYEDSPHQNLLFSPRKLTFVPIQKSNKDSVSTNKAFILKNKISIP